MAETSYYIISNIVELYILFRYYHAFFGKLTAPRWCIILLSLFLFCGSFSINLMQSVNLNLLASVLVTAGIGALYTGKWTKKAIYIAQLSLRFLLLWTLHSFRSSLFSGTTCDTISIRTV